MMKEFQALFQPGKIGKLEIKNRIVMASMALFYVAQDGSISDRQIDYYVARARGGAGLILTESAYPRRAPYPFRTEINDDRFIPRLSQLAAAIHNAGAKVILQLTIGRGRVDEVERVSASDVPTPDTGARPQALTVEAIERYVEEFGEGARRARESGFDGIVVHANGGYLVTDLLSPFTNKRTDQYGGSIERRARFAVDLVKAIKTRAGADYPVIFKLMSNEHIEEGLQMKDAIVICQLLEKAGADAIEVASGNISWTFEWAISPMGIPHCHNTVEAATLKRNLGIPVIAGGRIVEPGEAEDILSQGNADFISIGRALMTDPEWPNKARAGRSQDIRRCVGCLRCFYELISYRKAATCTVNAALGEERYFATKPASAAKRVLVIGGGPAGMEAARVGAQRGHEVTLWEKSDRLGGQLNIAIKPPFKAELGTITEYLATQINRLGVKTELEKKATVESVMDFAPGVVIVATGARQVIPDLPGVSGSNVVTAAAVLAGEAETGNEVVILGGGMVGCETADFLSERGRQVTILEILERIANDVNPSVRKLLLGRLERANVRIVTGFAPIEIGEDGVRGMGAGAVIFFPGDTVVLAVGMKADNELGRALEGKVPELYTIGDCVEPRRIFDAIYEGAHTSVKL